MNTKSRIFAILTLLALSSLGTSSTSYAQKLMLGPRVGMDIGSIAWDSASYGTNKSTILGLIAGAQLDAWFSGRVALSTGVMLDQKGWHEYNTFFSPPVAKSDLTLNYIEIPLLLKVAFGTGSIQPFLFAGPSFGYMIWGYTRQFQTDDPNIPSENDFKIDEVLNKFNFSIVGGAGLAYNLAGGQQIFIDGDYAYGLSNIISANESSTLYQAYLGPGYALYPVGAIRTRDIRIAAGMLFPI